MQVLDQQVHDGAQVLVRERPVEHDLVQPVQKLRPELRLEQLLHGAARLLADRAVVPDAAEDHIRPEVAREDDDAVLEVHRAALPVGDAAVVEHLQQHVEHVRVRLFHLVKEDDRIRPAAHGLGQLAALVVADVARRRADEAGDGVLLHVLGHVDAHHRALVVEQRLRQRLGQLRLAHARGAEEQERADGPVRVLDARARAQDRVAHALHGLVLADDALVQDAVQAQELLALALHQPRHGDAGPAGDDAGDLLLRHAVAQVVRAVQLLLGAGLLLLELLLQLRQAAVLELRRAVEVVGALRALNLGVGALDLLAQVLHAADLLLLVLPLGLHLAEFGAQVGQLLLDLREVLVRELIGLLFERGLLDLQLHDPARDVVQLRGHGVHLRLDQRARLVHQVDGLVGQEAVGDVAVGQRGRGDERLVLDLHAVEHLVALLEPAQDGDGVLHAGLGHHHRLEAALERGVLFDVLAVLVERGRADAVQLAAGEHGLEQVARVHGALGLARADDGVQLVDEQDDPPLGRPDLVEHGLEPLLKLAAELRPRHQRAHVQREELAVLQVVGHVAAHDAQRQPLCDGRLAHARLADEAGVVLRLAREDADDVADLVVAADDRVELLAARQFHQVLPVLFEHVVGALRVVGLHARAAAHALQLCKERLFRHAEGFKQPPHLRARLFQQAEEQVLDGDVLVVHLRGALLRGGERRVQLAREVDVLRRRAAHARQARHGLFTRGRERGHVRAHAGQQAADEPVRLRQQRVQQVLLPHLRVAVFHGHGVRGLHRLEALLRQFLCVHGPLPPCVASDVQTSSGC